MVFFSWKHDDGQKKSIEETQADATDWMAALQEELRSLKALRSNGTGMASRSHDLSQEFWHERRPNGQEGYLAFPSERRNAASDDCEKRSIPTDPTAARHHDIPGKQSVNGKKEASWFFSSPSQKFAASPQTSQLHRHRQSFVSGAEEEIASARKRSTFGSEFSCRGRPGSLSSNRSLLSGRARLGAVVSVCLCEAPKRSFTLQSSKLICICCSWIKKILYLVLDRIVALFSFSPFCSDQWAHFKVPLCTCTHSKNNQITEIMHWFL